MQEEVLKDVFSFDESVDEVHTLPKRREGFLHHFDKESHEKTQQTEQFMSKPSKRQRLSVSDGIGGKNSADETLDFNDRKSTPTLSPSRILQEPGSGLDSVPSGGVVVGTQDGTYKGVSEPEDQKENKAKGVRNQEEREADDNHGFRLVPDATSDRHVSETTGKALRVAYVYSKELVTACNDLPRISGRAGVVHSLLEALGLLQNIMKISPRKADDEEIQRFHSADFVEFLHRVSNQTDEEKVDMEEAQLYGLSYDCPLQEGVYDCAALVAGATLAGAEALCEGTCDVAINWCGGWHHAQRSSASGFCYINDIVLGILKLREKFSKIVYVDLDLHHGDGVEDAFSTTPHVLTISLHKHSPGFFPGTGAVSDVGLRRGRFYSVNIPLQDGVCDGQYIGVFRSVMSAVYNAYKPQAIVCQCGADGLAGDPMASFNLTQAAYSYCLQYILGFQLPTLVLGGGGYNYPNTARCWAYITAAAMGQKLPRDVPDHRYYMDYRPDFEMDIQAGNRPDCNKAQDLVDICNRVADNMDMIKDIVL